MAKAGFGGEAILLISEASLCKLIGSDGFPIRAKFISEASPFGNPLSVLSVDGHHAM
jgi:hypothetical protein